MDEFVQPTCCFCGEDLVPQAGITPQWWGNSPRPLMEDGVNRCCGDCNVTLVIPARLKAIYDV